MNLCCYILEQLVSDINECLTNNGGCNQTCHNSIGSYSCSCGIGFELHIDKHDCNGRSMT